MLSIGEDLVFVEMVHDVAVDYMLQYLTCDGGILLDFAKAFDKVPHQHLLHKLEYYGVNAKTKNWIQSFLQNRQQRVLLEGATSEQAPVLFVGSGGLFLGVIRMTWHFLTLKLICHLSSQSCSDVKSFCNNTLSAWLLGHTLNTVDASKYLGITISNNLTWDRHIDNTIGKGNTTLGFIRCNLKDCTKPFLYFFKVANLFPVCRVPY
jgi:hypothetical protein